MEKYILEKQESFNLKHIFECGQCFRWNKLEDNSYIGVIKDAVINVKEENGKFIFTGSTINGNLKEIIRYYFDLDTNYTEYKKILSNIDNYLKESIKFGSGIRILRQDLWECIISFIISANNNIPRIKKIIEKLSKEYGKKIEFNGNTYYFFPTPEELSKASVEDLRNLGLGFRDKRIYNTTKMIIENEVNLNSIKSMDDTEKMRNELLKLDGVGPKVADCILLFALKRIDVFPIDVWVRRVMNDLYIHNINEEKVNKKELQKLAEDKFGSLQGIAQQYLFYWKREEGKSA
ncbi:MAG TPA: 8-oxoguanine DNA glycosylase [Candidatus Scatovivens faecipullorum]|nr:8-oxoguanine DNA glycosylase [Candidatus Scatovivens faecipullorum]